MSRLKRMYRAWQHNHAGEDAESAFRFAWNGRKRQVERMAQREIEYKERIAELQALVQETADQLDASEGRHEWASRLRAELQTGEGE